MRLLIIFSITLTQLRIKYVVGIFKGEWTFHVSKADIKIGYVFISRLKFEVLRIIVNSHWGTVCVVILRQGLVSPRLRTAETKSRQEYPRSRPKYPPISATSDVKEYR